MKIIQALPHLKVRDGDIGIEVEVEGRHLPDNPIKHWTRHYDGSLRGTENGEWVLSEPLPLVQAKEALQGLTEAFRGSEAEIDSSVRAGVHVHINVQQMQPLELFNFITLYFIMEGVLVAKCGEGRQGNLFCLRATDAEVLLKYVHEAAMKGDITGWYNDDIRYSSLNLKAVMEHGSVEFRALRTPEDFSTIGDWVDVLWAIKNAAKLYGNPQEIVAGFSEADAEGFLHRILGDKAAMYTDVEGADKLLSEGMRVVQDYVFLTEWERGRKLGNPFRAAIPNKEGQINLFDEVG